MRGCLRLKNTKQKVQSRTRQILETQTSKVSKHLLIIGDALQVLKDRDLLPSESVSLIITSPPYGLGKDYGEDFRDDFKLSEWTHMINEVGIEARRVLKPNGSFFLNVSPIPHKKTSEILPLDSYAYMPLKKCGFYLRNKIIWHFHNMQNCTKRLSGRWEAVLWFVKDIKNYAFNLDAIRVPYLTNDKRIRGEGRNPTDVWYFNRVNNMIKIKLGVDHPCVYPEEMIMRIMKMSSYPDDLVLDPFVGSGTTMRVAKILNRNSVGIEINPRYEKLVRKRVEPEKPTLQGKCTFEVIRYRGG